MGSFRCWPFLKVPGGRPHSPGQVSRILDPLLGAVPSPFPAVAQDSFSDCPTYSLGSGTCCDCECHNARSENANPLELPFSAQLSMQKPQAHQDISQL